MSISQKKQKKHIETGKRNRLKPTQLQKTLQFLTTQVWTIYW